MKTAPEGLRTEYEHRAAQTWERAKKVRLEELSPTDCPQQSDLFLYSERRDAFYSEAALLVEEHGQDGQPLDRVYLCKEDPGQFPDANDIVEASCEDMFEGAADHVCPQALAELQRFLNTWWETHRPRGVVASNVGVLLDGAAVQGGAA